MPARLAPGAMGVEALITASTPESMSPAHELYSRQGEQRRRSSCQESLASRSTTQPAMAPSRVVAALGAACLLLISGQGWSESSLRRRGHGRWPGRYPGQQPPLRGGFRPPPPPRRPCPQPAGAITKGGCAFVATSGWAWVGQPLR